MNKLILAIGCLTALPSIGFAQDVGQSLGYETGVSTLGVYFAPTYEVNDKFSARAPIYAGQLSRTETIDGNPVTGKFDTTSGGLVADYRPFSGAFRLSGGVIAGGYSVSGTITNPKFNNTTYAGTASVTLKQKQNIVPVVSVGYNKTFANGLGVLAEFGAKIGTYTLTASDNFVPAAQRAQYQADVAAANREIQKLPAVPFITLGLTYKF